MHEKKAERKEAKQQELIALIPNNRSCISIAEAVLLFGISKDTIYRLVRLGKILFIKNALFIFFTFNV
ncbi:MAG: helix-turn-helix domain-containing protein [Bacteroidales bacterium]|jgi:DeoR/GlpR family transcriptional regulator of sugar metabolism|nr:helix-turn-helix domain-containing protein [Bacteroidales bacterium]